MLSAFKSVSSKNSYQLEVRGCQSEAEKDGRLKIVNELPAKQRTQNTSNTCQGTIGYTQAFYIL